MLVGGPSGHREPSMEGREDGRQAPSSAPHSAPSLGLLPRLQPVPPKPLGPVGAGRLQLDLECESKHSRTAISPRETFGSINKTAGPTALPCQPHTPDGGWVEDRQGPQPSWTL